MLNKKHDYQRKDRLKTKFAKLKKLSKTCKPLTPPKNTPYKPPSMDTKVPIFWPKRSLFTVRSIYIKLDSFLYQPLTKTLTLLQFNFL